MQDRYFDDFAVGDRFESRTYSVPESEIRAFAEQFDPQYWHLDAAAAANGPFKGIVASGWHTTAIAMRLVVDSGVLRATGVLGAGIDELRWLRPVRPGDVLRVRGEIVNLEAPNENRKAGTMRVKLEMTNQGGETVLSEVAILRLPLRPRERRTN